MHGRRRRLHAPAREHDVGFGQPSRASNKSPPEYVSGSPSRRRDLGHTSTSVPVSKAHCFDSGDGGLLSISILSGSNGFVMHARYIPSSNVYRRW
jgi:hypothetical protein